MSKADIYVNQLFYKYKNTEEIRDLKEEILSNLQARISDNLEEGLNEEDAFNEAIKNIDNIDMLIDGNRKVYINALKKEVVQITILYTLISWILTIPMRINFQFSMINTLILIILMVLGVSYLVLYKDKHDLEKVEIINEKKVKLYKKYTWIIWGIFISIITLANLSIRFASNVWFGREMKFNGPYDFAMYAITLLLPFITIIIPMIVSKVSRIINDYEVVEYEEA